jgi:uncharacterized repeat protein (TIGR03803 family)
MLRPHLGIWSHFALAEIAFVEPMQKQTMKTSLLILTATIGSALSSMAGTQYEILANANASSADWPRGPWVYSAGYFYGASQQGGANSNGSIFRCDPATGQFFLLHSFTGGNGGTSPSTGLFESPTNGRLYGVNYGGMNNAGTIYRIDKPGNFFETIHQFTTLTGGSPDGIPIEASDGKLYGVVGSGGAFGFGGIYTINLNGTGYQLLRAFTGTSGSTRGKGEACPGLVEGTDGNLYGVTPGGGSNDTGVFFAMSKNGVTYNVFREWPATGLHRPNKRLLFASDGNFYGSTSSGGAANRGGIFRISPTGDYTELHEFDNSPDGYNLGGDLIEGTDGYLYGCTFFPQGSLFRLAKDGSSFAVLHRFTGGTTDGTQPGAPLIETAPGVFHGTTIGGGTNNDGVIFRLETTVEAPTLTLRGPRRVTFRGRSLRLRGTAADDLSVVRVEYATRTLYKPAVGTTTWKARIRVKPTSSRVKVKLRSLDNDGMLSGLTTVRARRAE